MSTSSRLVANKYFTESCFKHTTQYPNTTRGQYKGIPVETFDSFNYDDVMFTVSMNIYKNQLKQGQHEVRPGAMKVIEQIW